MSFILTHKFSHFHISDYFFPFWWGEQAAVWYSVTGWAYNKSSNDVSLKTLKQRSIFIFIEEKYECHYCIKNPLSTVMGIPK